MKLINFFSIFCSLLTLIYVIADMEKYGIRPRVIITAVASLLIIFYTREQIKKTRKQRVEAMEVCFDQSLGNKRFDFDCSGIKHIQLAEYEGISVQSMGTNIDFLQQKGLVNFTKDPKDRRKKILSLSLRCHADITKFKKTSDLWVAEKN